MPKTKVQKEAEIKKLVENLQQSKAVVFSSFDGLTVAQSQQLRNDLRKEGVSYLAVKKTLLERALAETDFKGIDVKALQGSVALAFGLEDEVAAAKVLAAFGKTNEALKIQGGILENAFIDETKVIALSKLPSKDELLAKVVGSINAPVSGLVNVLAGNLRGLVTVLNAIQQNKA